MSDTIRRISRAEPVTALKSVSIVECGEELVDFLCLCPRLLLRRPHFQYRRETMIRKTVAEMLCTAAEALPPAYRLAIVEGWRPPAIQRRMYRTLENRFRAEHPEWSETLLRRRVNQFTAPMNRRVPPPHTTGGAVDLALADVDGRELPHSDPYLRFDVRAFAWDAPGLTDDSQRVRDVLGAALVGAGLTNYPSEYWHWSYGDQAWAYRGGHPNAIYGAVEPCGWQIDPNDDNDLPLELTPDE